MIRLILMSFLFLLSLLTVLRGPTNLLWYVSILVTEFSWIFLSLVVFLLLWKSGGGKFSTITTITGVASLILFAVPVVSAYLYAPRVKAIFGASATKLAVAPFTLAKMITGVGAKKVAYKTLTYDTANALTLDFYPASTTIKKPCIIVVHGGSWAGGDSQQLPELNSELAKAGYQVATINYRLAPAHKYPTPVDDVKTALAYLRSNAARLLIDPENYVLLGRSAGGQIVLSAAYTLNDPSIKGVISFYGPADMVWGYANPTNPLVLNSKKVMEDYLGGTYQQVPQQYVRSSATETAKNNPVPTLLIHGENDPLVSHLHGKRLGEKLESMGAKHYDIYLSWATHGFDYTLNGPAGQISTWSVKRFLALVLP
jgi:acetyl esterase/lipase